MIAYLFSFFVLPVAVTNSLPFEGYGILLVDLYEQPLDLPITDQETNLDSTSSELEQQSVSIPKEIDEQELESLADIIDVLSIISEGYKKPLIGIEMQLYRVDNGFRQDLVSMNMLVDPSDEEFGKDEYSGEDESEKSDSEDRVEFFVDLHHTYSPYDRLVNSYYGANSAKFLPMNLYKYFLTQSQQQPNMFPYEHEKLAADYWNMMLNQENLEVPSYLNYPSEYTLKVHNKAKYPTLEDALRMYEMEMEKVRSLDDSGEDPSEDNSLSTEFDVDDKHHGIFSSIGNFFGRFWRALFD